MKKLMGDQANLWFGTNGKEYVQLTAKIGGGPESSQSIPGRKIGHQESESLSGHS